MKFSKLSILLICSVLLITLSFNHVKGDDYVIGYQYPNFQGAKHAFKLGIHKFVMKNGIIHSLCEDKLINCDPNDIFCCGQVVALSSFEIRFGLKITILKGYNKADFFSEGFVQSQTSFENKGYRYFQSVENVPLSVIGENASITLIVEKTKNYEFLSLENDFINLLLQVSQIYKRKFTSKSNLSQCTQDLFNDQIKLQNYMNQKVANTELSFVTETNLAEANAQLKNLEMFLIHHGNPENLSSHTSSSSSSTLNPTKIQEIKTKMNLQKEKIQALKLKQDTINKQIKEMETLMGNKATIISALKLDGAKFLDAANDVTSKIQEQHTTISTESLKESKFNSNIAYLKAQIETNNASIENIKNNNKKLEKEIEEQQKLIKQEKVKIDQLNVNSPNMHTSLIDAYSKIESNSGNGDTEIKLFAGHTTDYQNYISELAKIQIELIKEVQLYNQYENQIKTESGTIQTYTSIISSSSTNIQPEIEKLKVKIIDYQNNLKQYSETLSNLERLIHETQELIKKNSLCVSSAQSSMCDESTNSESFNILLDSLKNKIYKINCKLLPTIEELIKVIKNNNQLWTEELIKLKVKEYFEKEVFIKTQNNFGEDVSAFFEFETNKFSMHETGAFTSGFIEKDCGDIKTSVTVTTSSSSSVNGVPVPPSTSTTFKSTEVKSSSSSSESTSSSKEKKESKHKESKDDKKRKLLKLLRRYLR